MKRFTIIAAAALLLLAGAQAGSQAVPSSPWLDLERRWNDAHLSGDVQALADLWADDLVVVVPKMAPFDKAASLNLWRTIPVKFTRYESSDIRVRESAEATVVTGRIARTRDFGGRSATDQWLFTKVYVKRAGRWQVNTFHASDAP